MALVCLEVDGPPEAVQKGDKVSILFLPLIDGLTAANLIHQFEVGSELLRQFLIGGIFFVEGAVMIYLSSKTDRIYDSKIFTWKDDDEFFTFIEYMGFSGVVAALTGVIYAFGQDQAEIAFFLTAAIPQHSPLLALMRRKHRFGGGVASVYLGQF